MGKDRFQVALSSLNQTQRDSVLSEANTLQILAGPGSGKTKVLTSRVAYFVIGKSISPSNIVVVTFTNKAANEMKKRSNDLIGEKKTDALLIGTFHAICCRLLRRYAKIVDLDPNFIVADNDMCKGIIKKVRSDPQLKISNFTRASMKVGAIWGTISKAKNKGETCTMYAKRYGSEFKTKDIAILFTAYEAELKKLNLVDFDNLLMKAVELLQKKKDVLSNVEAILVDEYQDTNVVQYDLVKLMTMQDNNKSVTIVGDPDQSIFGFRNAEPKNFVKMQKDFSDTGVINMEENYRSTGKILKEALHVISHDSKRFKKSLYTSNPEGKPILCISTDNEESQAEFVATEIKKVIGGSMGLINYKDIAILMRMNFISRQFEGVFRRHKIPFTIVGGDRFFDRVEVKDVLSYLNFAYNPKDYMSFSRIINVPKRGIGDTNIGELISVAQKSPIKDDDDEHQVVSINLVSDDESDEEYIDRQTNVFSRTDENCKTEEIADFLEYCLEWPCVFIATCNSGVIPHDKAESAEEECRLLYVGITRSKFLLYCVSPEVRDTERQSPSEFLNGMNKGLYSTKSPEWNDEMRLELAKTIRKTIPINNNGNVNNLKRSSDEGSSSSYSKTFSQSKKMKFV